MSDPRDPGGEDARLAPRDERPPAALEPQATTLRGLLHQRLLRASKNATRTTAQLVNFLCGAAVGFVLAALVAAVIAPLIPTITVPITGVFVVCVTAFVALLFARRDVLRLVDHMTTSEWKHLDRAQDFHDLQREKLDELARQMRALGVPEEKISAEVLPRLLANHDMLAHTVASLVSGSPPPPLPAGDPTAAADLAPPHGPVQQASSTQTNGAEFARGTNAVTNGNIIQVEVERADTGALPGH